MHDAGSRMKNPFDMFYIFYLWLQPKVTSLTRGWTFYLYSVPLIIPVDHVRKNILDPLGTPVPPIRTPGAWPRHQNKNPVWFVLYILFVRTHKTFGIQIICIDFVIIVVK